MRPAIYVALLIACAAIAPMTVRTVLVTAASVLLEALPYVVASSLLGRAFGRFGRIGSALAGCGCGAGPGARSLPVAAATLALFGPLVAGVRLLLAWVIPTKRGEAEHGHGEPVMGDLAALVPAAILCGLAVAVTPRLGSAHQAPPVQLLLGLLLGALAPCTLGGVALAASFHAQAPLACAGMLVTTGFVRISWSSHRAGSHRDPLAALLLAVACGVVVALHGADLIHPRVLPALVACAVVLCAIAARDYREPITRASLACAVLIVAVVIGAPAPQYDATAASLQELFPGERIDFAGVYAAHERRVVRYSITCCRADARPIAIKLARAITARNGGWVEVRGTVAPQGDALVVEPTKVREIAPPSDPFVYQ